MSDTETSDIAALHQALVDNLIEKECLTDDKVEAAFRAIPRHLFLPDTPIDVVYRDDAIPTKRNDQGIAISSSSQPAIMAIMLEQLGIQPGENVLEIGAGTGYNAALMGYLVGDHGRVTTIDIDQDIVDAANEHLAAAGCQNVTAVCGDGMEGYAPNAPYDRIILTVGGWEIPPAWLAQLKPDGRLLLPLSLKGPQYSIAFDRQNGRLSSSSVRGCGFMRLRGPNAGPSKLLSLGSDKEILIGYEDDLRQPRTINPETIYAQLTGRYTEFTSGIQAAARELFRSLMFWLAIHEPALIDVHMTGEMAVSDQAPYLFGFNVNKPACMSIGCLHEGDLALIVRPPGETLNPNEDVAKSEPFELYIRRYGDSNTAVNRLMTHLQNWDAAGRPNAENMQVEVYPIETTIKEGTAVSRRWHTFVIHQ